MGVFDNFADISERDLPRHKRPIRKLRHLWRGLVVVFLFVGLYLFFTTHGLQDVEKFFVKVPKNSSKGEKIVAISEGSIKWGKNYSTWYHVVGGSNLELIPVVLLSGGPGWTSEYMSPLATELAKSGRKVVRYDPLGCGRSWYLSDASNPQAFWKPELFVEEFSALREKLGLTKIVVFGHDWGGTLALYINMNATASKGIVGNILASAVSDFPEYSNGTLYLVEKLPPAMRDAIIHHEINGTTSSSEYQAAKAKFNSMYMYSKGTIPKCLNDSFAFMSKQVYKSLHGSSQFAVTGSLKDVVLDLRLDTVHDLPPALLLTGQHDMVTADVTHRILLHYPPAELRVFAGLSHMMFLEDVKRVVRPVSSFLNRTDGRSK